MIIAVAAGADGTGACWEESARLCIVETEGGEILRELAGPDPLGFAEAALESGAEATVSGEIRDAAAFEMLAAAGVTRYFAAGLSVMEAARAAEAGTLRIQTRPGVIR